MLGQNHGSAFRKYATKWERAANLCERERAVNLRESKLMSGKHAAKLWMETMQQTCERGICCKHNYVRESIVLQMGTYSKLICEGTCSKLLRKKTYEWRPCSKPMSGEYAANIIIMGQPLRTRSQFSSLDALRIPWNRSVRKANEQLGLHLTKITYNVLNHRITGKLSSYSHPRRFRDSESAEIFCAYLNGGRDQRLKGSGGSTTEGGRGERSTT